MKPKQSISKKMLSWLLIISLIVSAFLPGITMDAEAAGNVKLSKSKLTMYVGNSKTITIINASGKIKWSSSNKKIASVNSNGKIKARKAGKAVITAKVSGKKLTCKVTVKPAKPALNKKTATLAPGKTVQLKMLNSKGTVTWKSSNKSVATVSKKGKVTAKKPGTAKITATYKKKKYTCTIKVQRPKSTLLTITFDQESISTEESEVSVTGKISHDATLKTISFQLYDSEGLITQQGAVAVKDSWSSTVQPSIGTNTFTLTVTDSTGRSATNSLIIVRNSKELDFDEEIVTGDEDESMDFAENIADFQHEKSESDSFLSDTTKIVIKKDSELYQKLSSGEIKEGNTYILPPNDDFPDGFSGTIESWGAPSDSSVDSDTYIEVTFREPGLDDLFDGDGCIDFGGGVDPDDPIAFIMVPDGTEVSAISENEVNTYASKKYSRPYFPEGMSGFFQPKISAGNKKSLSIKLDLLDVLLYDKDMDPDTTDQLRLNGSLEISDITFDGSLEWKEKSGSLMPQQIKMDVSYNTKANVTLKALDSIDFKDIVTKANSNFENKIEKCGIQLSGIDMSERIMLGVIGLNFVASPTASIRRQASYTRRSIKPKYFIALYLDLSGELSAELSLSLDYSSYRECGFNVCNTKAKNIEGINSAIYTQTKDLAGDYMMGTYERERKSKTEYGQPEPKFVFDGKVKGNVSLGAGALLGVMMLGIIPGDVYGGCSSEAGITLDGKVEVTHKTTNEFLPNGDLEVNLDFKTGFILGVDLKFAIKIVEGFMKNWGLNLEISKNKLFPIFEVKLNFPTFKLEGRVYDLTDKTTSNHPLLSDVELYIYEKEKLNPDKKLDENYLRSQEEDFKGETDENGNYEIDGFSKKDYVLLVCKSGYQPYIKDDLSFSSNDITQDIYLEPVREANWLDVCKPSSYTQIYGEYMGDGTGYMTISGVDYDAGFYLDNGTQGTGGTSDAVWNLDGKYSSLDVRIGHLDNTNLLNAELYIYLDDSEDPNQTIVLNSHDVSRIYSIDLNYAKTATFSLKKTQSNNWAHSSFGFVEGVWHGKNGTEGTIHTKDPFLNVDWNSSFMEICSPYQSICCTTYPNEDEESFTMSGTEYTNGFVLRSQSVKEAWGNSAAMFNTNGNFSALKISVGHVDGTLSKDAEIYVFLDGESDPSQTYTIKASEAPTTLNIPLYYAKGVKISLQNVTSNWSTTRYGFTNGEWIK
ncbi:MAG: Ig-like domain-containing protein [Lachnospiraceae bacterium]